MVTYSELFQFCIVLISVAGLVYKICNKKSNRQGCNPAVTP